MSLSHGNADLHNDVTFIIAYTRQSESVVPRGCLRTAVGELTR